MKSEYFKDKFQDLMDWCDDANDTFWGRFIIIPVAIQLGFGTIVTIALIGALFITWSFTGMAELWGNTDFWHVIRIFDFIFVVIGIIVNIIVTLDT